MPKTGEISLYYHIPFCTKKCPYCHFFVIPHKTSLEACLIEGFKREMQWRKAALEEREILTVYFGGGTPSLLAPEIIGELIAMVGGSPKEITLELNPETVIFQRMEEYKKAGVNRVSIGVQSLAEEELLVLGRGHASSKAIDAVHIAKEAGFDNITIDLMFELPNQTLASWERTLAKAVALPITHLSLYNLTFEPHTSFHKRQKELLPLVPNDDTKAAMLQLAVAMLESAGLMRYEISAFAKDGFTSLHNTGYWKARPFLGFGPSAFSYFEGKRFRNACSLQTWSEALRTGSSPVDFEEQLCADAAFNELLAIELRLLSGVNLSTRSPLPSQTQASISRLIGEGLLLQEATTLRLSDKGLLFYDDVASLII
jgi:oxygen-independent coproporphyrinogen-3 oxidase